MRKFERKIISKTLLVNDKCLVFGMYKQRCKSARYLCVLECGHQVSHRFNTKSNRDTLDCLDCKQEFMDNFSYSKGSLRDLSDKMQVVK
jgi:hypothetical protein